MFRTDEGYAFVDFINTTMGVKPVIHSHMYSKEMSRQKWQDILYINECIDQAFRDKGFTELYTWGLTEEQEKYNVKLGYFPTGFEVSIEGYDGDPIYEYMKRIK